MSPIAAVAWGCQFLLETSGAVLAHRKRLNILAMLLAWRAIVDAVTFGIYIFGPETGYRFITWGARAVQYAILYALAVQIASKMIADYRPITRQIYKVLAVVGSVAAYIFAMTDVWAQKFAGADAITSLMLLAVVLLGWIGRKRELEETWRMITTGLLLAAFGNVLCSLASSYLSGGLGWSLYPIPAIAALIAWNWGLTRARGIGSREQNPQQQASIADIPATTRDSYSPMPIAQFRGEPNQERKPVQSVTFERREWVN